MVGNLFKSVFMHPKLTLTLFGNYKNSFVKEYVNTLSRVKMRLFLFGLSVVSFIFGLSTLFGAVLLWAALPHLNPDNAWMLIVLPFTLLIACAILYVTASRYRIQPNLKVLNQQFRLDLKSICTSSKKE